jgi:tetratricopeptide (TPR) repeat protein
MELLSLPPDELERRHDELNAALDRLVERGEPEAALEAEQALVVFWMTKGHLDEGRRWLERLLGAGDPPANLRAAGLAGAGVLAFRQGDDAEAQRMFEESAELARNAGADAALVLALNGLSRVALRAGDAGRTRELSLQVLELVSGDSQEYSPRHMLAAAARAEGDYAKAEELYGVTLELSRRLGRRSSEAGELVNLGYVALHRGETALAIERFQESLEIAAELDDDYLLPYAVMGAASSALARGHREEAARLLGAAKAAFDRTGAAIDPGSAEEYEAAAAELEGFQAAIAEGSRLSLAEAASRARRARPA